MSPREAIIQAANALHARRKDLDGDFDAELDESTGIVTVYLNRQPHMYMHVDDFLRIYDETAQRHPEDK